MQEDFQFNLGQTENLKIQLNQDYSALVLDDNGRSTGIEADWNMIYDQAIYVNIPDLGR